MGLDHLPEGPPRNQGEEKYVPSPDRRKEPPTLIPPTFTRTQKRGRREGFTRILKSEKNRFGIRLFSLSISAMGERGMLILSMKEKDRLHCGDSSEMGEKGGGKGPCQGRKGREKLSNYSIPT